MCFTSQDAIPVLKVHQHGRGLSNGFDVNNEVSFNKIKKEKTERKSEIIQKTYVFSVKMPKVSQNVESVEKKEEATKSQQQKSHPAESWFY